MVQDLTLVVEICGHWSPLDKAFIDVRVFNPQAESNWKKIIKQMYVSHEVENGSLTAAVFSTSGGMGRECDKLVRQIAMKLSQKRGERCGWICTKRDTL